MIREGKWWKEEHDVGSLCAYIERLEEAANRQDQDYHAHKIAVSGRFLRECKEVLEFDEIVFLCLRLAGYTYPAMERGIRLLSESDSTMQRKVRNAIQKLDMIGLPPYQRKRKLKLALLAKRKKRAETNG